MTLRRFIFLLSSVSISAVLSANVFAASTRTFILNTVTFGKTTMAQAEKSLKDRGCNIYKTTGN